MSSSSSDGKPCVFGACCCCYDACDFHDIALLCHGGGDCLCIRSSSCCAMDVKPRGVGCVGVPDKGECCKIGCYCCDCGIVTPRGTYISIYLSFYLHIMYIYRWRVCVCVCVHVVLCVCAFWWS